MNPTHNIRNKNLFLEVPVDNEPETKIAVINWIQLLKEPFYVAGITFMENLDNDPYNGGSSVWVLRRDNDAGLIAMCCDLYWTSEQDNIIKEEQQKYERNMETN